MAKVYCVRLYFADGTIDDLVISTNDRAQLEARIKGNTKLTCQETKRIIDTRKVFSYQISKS